MKLLLLVTFLAGAYAEAEPEADPYLLYGGHFGYGGHYGYAGYAGLGYAYGAYGYPYAYAAAAVKPCTNNAGVAVPCALGYHGGLAYGYGWPYLVPAAAAAPAEDGAAVEEARKKRDADADPAVLATYGSVKTITPLIHNAPVRPVVATYAHHGLGYGLGLGYHGLGYGGLYGLHGKKKREAEAEADPYLLYGAGLYGYGGYGLGHLGYGGHYGYAYHPITYAAGCRNYLGAVVPCAGA